MTRASDDDLMVRFADGSYGAFEALYARHKDAVYRCFLRVSNISTNSLILLKIKSVFQTLTDRVTGLIERICAPSRFLLSPKPVSVRSCRDG